MCTSKPKAQDVPVVVPPPAPVSESSKNVAASVKSAQESEALKAKLAKGQGSTILTGPLGDQSTATVKKNTLLGGV